MLRHALIATAGGALLAASGAALAQDAIDLTGTYEATYTCEGTFDGEPFVESLTFEALVLQRGRHIRLQYDDDGASSVYEGVVNPIEPGGAFLQGVVQVCGGDFDFEELLRIENGYEFEAEDGVDASFNGLSIFVTRDFPGDEGALDIETCVYAFNRTSATRPSVPRCDFEPRVGELLD